MQAVETTTKTCPECKNHCPVDNLQCPKGMEHFGIETEKGKGPGRRDMDISKMEPDEAVLVLMRQCGHYLHHNVGHGGNVDPQALLSSLSMEEKKQLIALLSKCTSDWNSRQ